MANEIKTYTVEELGRVLSELKQPKFRAKQLYEWLHTHRVTSYDEMTNLPKSLREVLSEKYPLDGAQIIDRQISADGTRKYVLQYPDGCCVETVGMPVYTDNSAVSEGEAGEAACTIATQAIDRLTVCFSTQVGCAMECEFCATGKEGLTRNLTAAEMVEQLVVVEKDFGCRVTNAVAMGQGEPFQNYDELIDALREINSPSSLNIGARHITVSTCGLIPGIKRFSEEPEQFTLAISLHSAIQRKRDKIMPRVSSQKIVDLKKALVAYVNETNRRVTLEYLLIEGVNDGEDDLKALLDFCLGLLCHVNLLPMNRVEGANFQPSRKETVRYWNSTLAAAGIESTLRKSRGSDIAGACGQLKNSLAGK